MNQFILLEDENSLRKANLECNNSKKLKERRRRRIIKKEDETKIMKKRKNREKENIIDSSNHIRKYYKYTKNDMQKYNNLKRIKNKEVKDKIENEKTKDFKNLRNFKKNNILNEKNKNGFNNKNSQYSNKSSLVSSDTGLADSMEHFNLLSSDPIDFEDSYYSFDTIEKSESFMTTEDFNSCNTELNDIDKSLLVLDEECINNNSNNNSHRTLSGVFATTKFEEISFKELFNRSLSNGTAPKLFNNNIEDKCLKKSYSTTNIFLNYTKTKNIFATENIEEKNQTNDTINNNSNDEFNDIRKSLFIVGGNENLNLSNNKLLPYLIHFTALQNFDDEKINLLSAGEDYFIIVKNSSESAIENEVFCFGSCFTGKILCGKDITLFLTEGGDLYYIGTISDNNGNSIVSDNPSRIKVFRKKLIQIGLTSGYIYGISYDNKLYTWNYNKTKKHEILFNIKLNKTLATEIKFDKKFSRLYTNNKYHGFIIDVDNNVYGGQLGLGHDDEVEGLHLIEYFKNIKIKQISCGNFHSLFLTDDGFIYSCGKNDHGQLGSNLTSTVWTPIQISTLKNCVTIAAGENHSLAIIVKENENSINNIFKNISPFKTLYAWGNAECYELGTGTNKNQLVPKNIDLKVKLSPLQKSKICHKSIKYIAAGKGYTLILTE
ncbi:RCC1/BLIP-II [Neocallimastix lanati (nom. inval.)]|nr:RCC1/BLIP-II [Neocallimastix sp. JGI-2020a]